jgi:hypothetical protein
MKQVVITVIGGVADIAFQDDDVDVTIIDLDNEDTYLYKDNHVCIIDNVNDDGTVDLKCLYSLDKSGSSRYFNSVPVSDISFYYSEEEIDFLDEDSDDEYVEM